MRCRWQVAPAREEPSGGARCRCRCRLKLLTLHTPRFGVLLPHLLLLLPHLLPHRDSLPPHPAHFSRPSHASRLLPPLPPYRRLRPLPRNCESACRMPMAHAVLTVFHALWQVIAKPFLRARAQAAHPPAQLGAGCSSVPVSWSVQRIGHARLRRDCYAPTGRRERAPRPTGGGFTAKRPVYGPQCML